MQNLFIKGNEEFTVNFYVAVDEDGIVWANSDEKSLKEMLNPKKKYEIKDYFVSFKKPSFGDTIDLYNDIFKTSDGANVEFNPLTARYQKISLLIKDWNLTDEKGEKVEPTEENVKSLHPIIANVIGLQLDSETGGLLT